MQPDLTNDRPTAAELLEIVADTLSETVVPATAPHARHQARVAANLCRIVARELSGGSEPISNIDLDAEDAFAEVQRLVRAKLAVNKPGYDAHDAAAEEAIIVR